MKKFKNFIRGKKRVFIILGIVLVITIIVKLVFFNKSTKIQYQTTKVEKGTIVSSVSASGQILNANTISINTQASGTVKQIYVKDGDVVQNGDKILEISLDLKGTQKNSSAWSSYLSAKNTLDSAQVSNYTLQSDMFTKWETFFNLAINSTYQNSDGSPNYINRALPEFHIAEKNWLAAEAKYKNQQSVISQAQAALNSAWLAYQLTSPIVTAPMDGTLTNLVVVEGMVINNDQSTSTSTTSTNQSQVAVIQNDNKPLASFNLSEIDIPKINPGQKATITLDSISDKTFTGKVMTVDRIGTTSSGVTTYPVIIQLDTNVAQILPNMAASANIILDSKNDVLYVPSTAIQNSGNQNYVRILKNNKEQQANVETGLTSDTETEITSGLKEGDVVITNTITNTTSTSTNKSSSPFSGIGGMRMGR